MPAPSESPAALEHQLAERLPDFERLAEAWPRGRTAIERAEIGRQRGNALSGIEALAAPALKFALATNSATIQCSGRARRAASATGITIVKAGTTLKIQPAQAQAPEAGGVCILCPVRHRLGMSVVVK